MAKPEEANDGTTITNVVSPLLGLAAPADPDASVAAGAEAETIAVQRVSECEVGLADVLAGLNLTAYAKQISDEGFESIHDLIELTEEEATELGASDLGMKRGEVRPLGWHNGRTTAIKDAINERRRH